jgi:hypothetical protein
LLQDLRDCVQGLDLVLENLPLLTDEIKLVDWVKQNVQQFKKIDLIVDYQTLKMTYNMILKMRVQVIKKTL